MAPGALTVPASRPSRPPATLALAVVLVHVLALQAARPPRVLAASASTVQVRLAAPMPLLPTDTSGVVMAPQETRHDTPPAGPQRPAGWRVPTAPPATAEAAAAPVDAAVQATAGLDGQADATAGSAPAINAGPGHGPATAQTPLPIALPAAPRLPGAARWHYVATQRRRGLLAVGSGSLDWAPQGTHYSLQLAWSVPGMPARSHASTGAMEASGLAPRRYGVRGRGEFATHMDAAEGRVVFSSNRPRQPLAEGLQDRASVLLQLAGWLAADPGRFTPGVVLRVPTVGSHDAADWDFTVDGAERLVLPGGTVETLRLTRVPAGPWELRMEAWFAPGMDYAPVRLRMTPPNGDWLDLQWSGTDSR